MRCREPHPRGKKLCEGIENGKDSDRILNAVDDEDRILCIHTIHTGFFRQQTELKVKRLNCLCSVALGGVSKVSIDRATQTSTKRSSLQLGRPSGEECVALSKMSVNEIIGSPLRSSGYEGAFIHARRTFNTSVVWLLTCEPRVPLCLLPSPPHPVEPSSAVPSSGNIISNTHEAHLIYSTLGEGQEPQRGRSTEQNFFLFFQCGSSSST